MAQPTLALVLIKDMCWWFRYRQLVDPAGSSQDVKRGERETDADEEN